MPGGIANRSFVVDWGAWCRAMDENRLALLPQHTRYGLMLIARRGTCTGVCKVMRHPATL